MRSWSRSAWALVAAFVACEFAANWLAATFLVPLGAWLVPGGSVVIPIAMLVRDALHEGHPRSTLVVAFVLGVAVSVLWSRDVARVAWASAAAFGVSFTVDTVVYNFVRTRRLVGSRVAAMRWSNWASLPVDTLVFVPLAFGGTAALGALIPGQVAVKVLMTEVGILAWRGIHKRGGS